MGVDTYTETEGMNRWCRAAYQTVVRWCAEAVGTARGDSQAGTGCRCLPVEGAACTAARPMVALSHSSPAAATTSARTREKRLRRFGHVQRKDKDDATRKILQMTVDGKRNRGRPKLRWRDLVKEDMARNPMTTEMAEDRKHWHVMSQAGTLRSVEADR